ncbi:2-dehydropantoate 2-reductase [Methylobacterium planeticum]|uniref:2-dehydropantoate 2-reductase n=1 Tax=Methylobacterium planeticum TaxID=2615211 RepID=A0A6N6MWN2_9HYPH|nr:2-dehydropantoate 2-reductase [Methylobacterium planeticum]KAB1076317.1 2-dehydropantoate 2-reductase [Methylobacterium planeticum]
MRVLVVGAGATGGYYGARLAEAGRDVTFLVRPARAEKLAADGLSVKSPLGDLHLRAPMTITADALAAGQGGAFDLVLLSCKAYDLDAAVADLAPAVRAGTIVLPILNGMRHLDVLDARFGAERVLGGSCGIMATVGPGGEIRHMSEFATLTYGERDGSRMPRVEAIEALMRDARFQPKLSPAIVLEMWEKWVFLATLAGITCLMRASVGDIVGAPGGREAVEDLYAECVAVAAAAGYAPREKAAAQARAMLTQEGAPTTASMLRDIEARARIEADHVVGDLIARGDALAPGSRRPGLERAYTHLKAYERRRAREAA